MGWSGMENGELLRRATGHIDAFVTMDRRLQHQQNVSLLPYGVVLVRAKSNRVHDLIPLVPELLSAIAAIKAGDLEEIGGHQS